MGDTLRFKGPRGRFKYQPKMKKAIGGALSRSHTCKSALVNGCNESAEDGCAKVKVASSDVQSRSRDVGSKLRNNLSYRLGCCLRQLFTPVVFFWAMQPDMYVGTRGEQVLCPALMQA